MKKVLLTAALGCAFVTSAFAQDPGDGIFNNTFNLQVNDYLVVDPTTDGNYDITPVISDAATMNMVRYLTDNFKVTANRSWHTTYTAEDFVNPTPGPNVDGTIPVEVIYDIQGTANDPEVTVEAPYGTYQPVTNPADGTPVVMRGMGGTERAFTLTGRLTPADAQAEYNMSGTYTTTVHVITSLD